MPASPYRKGDEYFWITLRIGTWVTIQREAIANGDRALSRYIADRLSEIAYPGDYRKLRWDHQISLLVSDVAHDKINKIGLTLVKDLSSLPGLSVVQMEVPS